LKILYSGERIKTTTRDGWITGITMLILLMASMGSQETLETLHKLTLAALSREHDVIIFFNGDSTKLLKDTTAKDEVRELGSRGVRLLACRTSAQEMELTLEEDLMEGAEMSGLGELVELMGEAGRVLFLG
jgi:predicted peroxiredoxin